MKKVINIFNYKRATKLILLMSTVVFISSCNDSDNNSPAQADGIAAQQTNGKEAFRFETFGNEGFWTDAAKLPQGIVEAGITPVQALQTGLSVNVQKLDAATAAAVVLELKNSGTTGPILNDPATTIKLINANAVIGVVVKDTNGDGVLDVASGDKVGVSCVLCHGITDKSVLDVPNGGSIGVAVDGPAAHTLNVGAIFALAKNTRAFYPMAQLKGANGSTIGKNPTYAGLTKLSSEASFDAYFNNPANYPAGSFDDTVDGNGNPMHNTPLFRQDLAAPFGSAGELEKFEFFANTVFTVLLDPTNLLSPGGRAFLAKAAGAAGTQMANDYSEVLADTGVTNYPYIKVSATGTPGTQETLIGLAVDYNVLLDMRAYVESLRSPVGVIVDQQSVDRGRLVFNNPANACLTCHNADNSIPVQTRVIEMKTIFPGDNPTVLANREPPAGPVLNTEGAQFDDKMIVINATLRGDTRGAAMPLLMDLARKPVFLHDSSVASLNELLNTRGPNAPHPFYVLDSNERWDLVEYLKSLDDRS